MIEVDAYIPFPRARGGALRLALRLLSCAFEFPADSIAGPARFTANPTPRASTPRLGARDGKGGVVGEECFGFPGDA